MRLFEIADVSTCVPPPNLAGTGAGAAAPLKLAKRCSASLTTLAWFTAPVAITTMSGAR